MDVSIIKLPIWITTPPIKLSSTLDFSLIEPLMFSEISFSRPKIVLSSIFFDEIKFALISPFLWEINCKNSSINFVYLDWNYDKETWKFTK